eukprot:UN28040
MYAWQFFFCFQVLFVNILVNSEQIECYMNEFFIANTLLERK